MSGLIKHSEDNFEIKLDKYCSYFDSLLAIVTFFPDPIHKMVDEKEKGKLIDNWCQNIEKICVCGAFKVKEINNIVNGKIGLVKNSKYCFGKDVKVNDFTFEIIVGQTTAESKFNSGQVDYTDIFDKIVLQDNEKELFLFENALWTNFRN